MNKQTVYSDPELGGHGHELNGHRCPCPRHGHGRGMDTNFLRKRGVDMDMVTKKSVKRGVDMNTVTKNLRNVAWTWSRFGIHENLKRCGVAMVHDQAEFREAI